MTTSPTQHSSPVLRQLISVTSFWFIHRSPVIFGLACLLLVVIFFLTATIPQQPTEFTQPSDFVVWVSNLPPFYRQAYLPLDALGFFNLYQSAWFWLPTAWLTLICLTILGDYFLPTLQRCWKPEKNLKDRYHHPFSHYQEKTILLNAPQNTNESTNTAKPLTELQQQLLGAGYKLIAVNPEEGIIASRLAWRWLIPPLVIIGILLVILGGIIQFLGGESTTVLLSPNSVIQTTFTNDGLKLNTLYPTIDATGNILGGTIALSMGTEEDFTWHLHRPYRQNGWWVIPAKIEPAARITFKEGEEFDVTQLVFTNATKPIYFGYSPQNLQMILHYYAGQNERGESQPTYRLSIVNLPQEPIEITQSTQTFAIPGLNLEGQIVFEDKLRLNAYKLPGLIPFVSGGLIFIISMILLILQPPVIIELNTITKGRGGRIEVLIETLGYTTATQDILDNLLVLETEDTPPDG